MEKVATTRPAARTDFEFAWRLYAEAVQPLMEAHIHRRRGEAWVEEREQARFSEIWEPSKVEVIKVGEVPIGWFSVDSSEKEVVLENFYIDASYRGRGLGTAILRWLTSQHAGRTVRAALISGSRPRSLFGRVGFEVAREHDFETVMQTTSAA